MTKCMNCGVPVHEWPENADVHPIQCEYRTEDGESFCEACFFPSYDRDGVAIAAQAMADRMSAGEVADALEASYTKERLRRSARALDVSLERGITKRGVAEELARARGEFMLKTLIGDQRLGGEGWY